MPVVTLPTWSNQAMLQPTTTPRGLSHLPRKLSKLDDTSTMVRLR